jgi:hypothetical protein
VAITVTSECSESPDIVTVALPAVAPTDQTYQVGAESGSLTLDAFIVTVVNMDTPSCSEEDLLYSLTVTSAD